LEKISRFVFGLSAVADFLFGYDFFISYAHRDGTQYPRLLRDRLEALGYRTLLDVHGYTGGDDLCIGTRRRIGMSKRLILLHQALSSSRWVELELQLPRPRLRRVRLWLQDRRSIREDSTDLDGLPSEATIQELVRSFDATRQETIRLRVLGAATVLFISSPSPRAGRGAPRFRSDVSPRRSEAMRRQRAGSSRRAASWPSGMPTPFVAAAWAQKSIGPGPDALKRLHKMWAEQANKRKSPPNFPTEGFGSIPNVRTECGQAVATRLPATSARLAPMEVRGAATNTCFNFSIGMGRKGSSARQILRLALIRRIRLSPHVSLDGRYVDRHDLLERARY
jgi:hypothetical protein